MIPQSVLDQIQDRCDIAEVVAQYVTLKRAGKSFKACCPFHQEKTPSFVVTPEKQIYHCFGCGVGGNVFSFLMKIDNIDFREAARRLGEKAGVPIPEDEARRSERDELEPLYEANRLAAEYFRLELERAPESSPVREYVKKRGIGPEALSKFRLGYSPDSWDRLLKHLEPRFGPPAVERAGLALARQSGGGYYDRFRNRLMFPVTNAKGAIVGFGARSLDGSEPKYLNSPETPVYRKGRILYGFFEALEGIRSQSRVLVVEGYMDTIACFEAGVNFAVASSGTALTTEQIRQIKRYTSEVVLLFDADQAGQSATLRGVDLLIEEDCKIRVATMPAGHDPDSFVREFGAEKFRAAVVDAATDFFEYKFGSLAGRFDLLKAEGKAAIAGEMLQSVRRTPNEVLKAAWTRELAVRLGVTERSLWSEMARSASGPRPRASAEPPVKPEAAAGPVPLFEKTLVGLVVSFEGVWERAKGELDPAALAHANARWVIERALEAGEYGEVEPSRFLGRLTENEPASRLVRDAVHEVGTIEDADKAFEDCLKHIAKKDMDVRMKVLRGRIAECERSRDQEGMQKLLEEYTLATKKGK